MDWTTSTEEGTDLEGKQSLRCTEENWALRAGAVPQCNMCGYGVQDHSQRSEATEHPHQRWSDSNKAC